MNEIKIKELVTKIISVTLKDFQDASIAFRFWDGSEFNPNKTDSPALTVILRDPEGFLGLLTNPDELALAEAYFSDVFDLEGDLSVAVLLGESLGKKKWSKTELAKLAGNAISLSVRSFINKQSSSFRGKGKAHTVARDKEAVSYTYDTSNDFYALWLDKNMIYSGAYFPRRDATVDEAQDTKLEYICKKLLLKHGETLLDIGCGWGALVIHAAKNYGVKATGVTLSKQQADFANAKIRQLGLQDKCEVKLMDYREVPEARQFDKIASVEMLHHVGEEVLPEYFRKIRALLKPGGISFQLGITTLPAKGKYKSPAFADKYFMPDYHLVSISTYLDHAEKQGFEIYDLEDVREHYYLTSKHWLSRLEARHNDALKYVNEFTYRVVRLSLFLMMAGFQKGMMGFYHFILLDKKTDIESLPVSREGIKN